MQENQAHRRAPGRYLPALFIVIVALFMATVLVVQNPTIWTYLTVLAVAVSGITGTWIQYRTNRDPEFVHTKAKRIAFRVVLLAIPVAVLAFIGTYFL